MYVCMYSMYIQYVSKFSSDTIFKWTSNYCLHSVLNMLFIVLQEVHNMREKLVRGDLDTSDYNSQMREKTKLLPLTVSLTNTNDSFP